MPTPVPISLPLHAPSSARSRQPRLLLSSHEQREGPALLDGVSCGADARAAARYPLSYRIGVSLFLPFSLAVVPVAGHPETLIGTLAPEMVATPVVSLYVA